MLNLDLDIGLDISSEESSVQAVAYLDSNKTNATDTKFAWGGALESVELQNESGNDFLAVESALDFSAILSGEAVEVDLTQVRKSATQDELTMTVKSDEDTVTVNHLIRTKEGSIVELDAVKSSTGETASASEGVIIVK